MTIQPIASTEIHSAAQSSTRSTPPPQPEQMPQDTVHLSPQAQASLDADHDGDSH